MNERILGSSSLIGFICGISFGQFIGIVYQILAIISFIISIVCAIINLYKVIKNALKDGKLDDEEKKNILSGLTNMNSLINELSKNEKDLREEIQKIKNNKE